MRKHIHHKNPAKTTELPWTLPAATLAALLGALLTAVGLFWPVQAAEAAVVPNAITSVSTTSTVDGQWSQVDFTCQWAVPDGSQPGDTFTLQLPPQLRWFGPADFALTNPSGETVATAHASDSGLVVFTLGSFVASHQGIGGTCSFSTLYAEQPTSGGTTQLDFQVGSTVIRVPVTIDQPCQQDCAPKPPATPEKGMWWSDTAQTELKSVFHLPATTLPTSDVTITDTPGPGTQIDCSQIVPRVGTSLDQDGNIATPSDEGTYPAVIACTPSLLTATWTGLPKGELVQLFVVTKVTDGTLDTYTNSGHVTVAGKDTPVMVEVRRTSGSGTGNGSALPSPTPTVPSPTPTPDGSTGPATPLATSTPATGATVPSTAPAAGLPPETPAQPQPTAAPLAYTGAGGTAVIPLAVLLLAAGTVLALLGMRRSAKRRVH
ncbi:Ig-like domain-containing protein [Arthrobacter sp. MMS24-S77]